MTPLSKPTIYQKSLTLFVITVYLFTGYVFLLSIKHEFFYIDNNSVGGTCDTFHRILFRDKIVILAVIDTKPYLDSDVKIFGLFYGRILKPLLKLHR